MSFHPLFRIFLPAALLCLPVLAQVTPMYCLVSTASPKTIRVEGVAELVSDIVLECIGGTPTAAGAPVPQSNVQFFFSADVTSRLLDGAFSEALLLIDEPGSPANPVMQVCATPTTGICGTTGTGTGIGVYDGSAGRPNMFQGRHFATGVGANSLLFQGVPIDPPGLLGRTRKITLTNVRVNANMRGPVTMPMTPIAAFIAVTGVTSVPLNNPTVEVARIGNGMDFSVNSPVTLSQCVAENPALAANANSDGISQFNLTFTEGFVDSFNRRTIAAYVDPHTSPTPAAQTVPGTIWNTESGFFNPLFPPITGRGNLGIAGLADAGTRLRAKLTGIPANVKLFVQNTITSGQLVARLISTTPAGEGPFAPIAGNGFGISPVPVSGTGEAYVVFEVLRADAAIAESIRIPMYVAYSTPLPGLGTASASGALAPFTTVLAADAAAPVPRFVEVDLAPAFTINPCTGKRMTGGGSVFTSSNVRVTHGFTLQCDKGVNPNNLEVNWNGNRFHLESLTSATCSDDPAISAGNPKTSFDTYTGAGSGRYNGVSGATATWKFTDAGEPGKDDTAQITIKDNLGNTVLTVGGKLDKGNHQAH